MPELFRAMDLKRVRAAEGYALIVSCVMANLVKAGERRVIVKLGDHARYERLSQKQLKRALPVMAELGWVELTKGRWQGDASTIARLGLDLAGLETMKESKEGLVVRKKGKPVDPSPYFTQDEIGVMKAELLELNKFLAAADITWASEYENPPDLSNREVYRVFNVVEGLSKDEAGDGYCGFGRLYGPFWVSMKKLGSSSAITLDLTVRPSLILISLQ